MDYPSFKLVIVGDGGTGMVRVYLLRFLRDPKKPPYSPVFSGRRRVLRNLYALSLVLLNLASPESKGNMSILFSTWTIPGCRKDHVRQEASNRRVREEIRAYVPLRRVLLAHFLL